MHGGQPLHYAAPAPPGTDPVPTTLLQSNLPGLELIHRGKVRDVDALDRRPTAC